MDGRMCPESPDNELSVLEWKQYFSITLISFDICRIFEIFQKFEISSGWSYPTFDNLSRINTSNLYVLEI